MSDDEYDENPTLIVDNGSGTIMAGESGSGAPEFELVNCIGKTGSGEEIFGNEAQTSSDVASIAWPIELGVIKDFESMEKIWHHLLDKEVEKSATDFSAVMLTECPCNTQDAKSQAIEMWFEKFNAKRYMTACGAILGIYGTGKESGVAVDSGDGITFVVPTFESYSLAFAIRRLPIAGRHLTNYLTKLLKEADITLTTSEVATPYAVAEMKSICRVADMDSDEIESGDVESQEFEMPDKSKVTLTSQIVQVPELMFEPHLDDTGYAGDGLHHVVYESLQACPLETRATLLGQEGNGGVVMMGGNTMFDNMGDRLKAELIKLTGAEEVKVISNPERQILPFIGADIVCEISGFHDQCIKKKEYSEAGASVLSRMVIC